MSHASNLMDAQGKQGLSAKLSAPDALSNPPKVSRMLAAMRTEMHGPLSKSLLRQAQVQRSRIGSR
ncbi:hypothetical protein D9M68_1002980 [compost metagenome]